jgi:MFS superfamily sulfate permease-like transporter
MQLFGEEQLQRLHSNWLVSDAVTFVAVVVVVVGIETAVVVGLVLVASGVVEMG